MAVQVVERAAWKVRPAARVAFIAFFVPYVLGGLFVLAQGLGAVLAARRPDLHETFHFWGFGSGPLARVGQRMADASHRVGPTWHVLTDYGFTVLNLALAGFVLFLRPGDRTVRLLAVGLVGAAGVFNLTAQGTLEILPMLPVESVAQAGAHIVAGVSFVYALLLFPDGRPVPRWKWPLVVALYAPVTAVAVAQALLVEGTSRPGVLLLFFGLATPIAGVVAQGYRFLRPVSAVERQQARLLFWALLPALIVGVIFVATGGLGGLLNSLEGRHNPNPPEDVFRTFKPVLVIVALALLAGIFRYRLWDIDRLLNRTIVYAAATGLLVLLYAGVVVLLQAVTAPITRESDIAVAASTLAVAAAFRPVLGRVQGFVDRRFYRRRYDAARTVETFSASLREKIDVESIRAALSAAAVSTVEPSSVSVWLIGDGAEPRNESVTAGR